jgi:hypothetical protein
VFHQRVENVYFDIPCTITFKAVGRIDKFLLSLNLAQGNEIFFYKGLNIFDDEGDLNFDGFQCICKKEVVIPGPEKITRYLIGYKSIVPRGTNQNKKNISSFM